ncbi:pyruvoyl-dependent arginine decarboxylase [Natrarchaeobius oligotrophus]|uniref:arginine decarboxylase n=1 Tax=Natrarchaeobius chitinivorans TaxID=1679083 RepID=A0A3N6ML59_NATCH|nr:pyruvoyl-dependent arginine decarboxylase [Natrarchaeobius chitinivorans]RQG96721.1 pyruvoyl-dependent arginine decarboxylase [Natrarchaeobius chitinivorans]
MATIRVVWGSASAPTAMASYDAALAEAGVENYNLVSVSSVIPADVPVEAVATAPDLGPAGERLTVVESRATTAGPGRVSAALAWSRSVDGGPGLFYEAADETDPDDVERRVRKGLDAGKQLREWEFDEPRLAVESADAESGAYTTAVVLAVYGASDPIV